MKLRTIAASAAVATLALVGLTGCSPHYGGGPTVCKITGKDRGGQHGDMRVYTEACGTFAVADDPFRGNFNSADVYGSLQVGHTYRLDAYGYRNGFTSTFPNIEAATEVAQ